MASPPTIPVEDWLVPIPGADPSGRSLVYDPAYDLLREARRAEDATNLGDWERDAKAADWNKVVTLGGDCLRTRSKDLQIAAWVAEALTHLEGFAGLRDGLALLHGIQSRFWETYYPKIDDGDVESRFAPFLFLNDPRVLPFLIRRVPVTRGLAATSFSFARYQESRETENLNKKDPEKSKADLKGRITAKTFDDQVVQTPRRFYEELVLDHRAALAAFRAFETETDARFGPIDAPSLTNIGQALDEVQRWLEPVLADKRKQEPDAEPPPSETPTANADSPAPAPATEPATAPTADFGRLLIEFRALALGLAEAGSKLEENRKKHAELQAELRKLDEDYAAITRTIGRDDVSRQLLRKLLDPPGAG